MVLRVGVKTDGPMPALACIFDAYGTLFDVSAAAREASGEPGRESLAGRWSELSDLWRQKQLQYTWIRAVAGEHADFWKVTGDALDWALEAAGLDGDPALRARLLDLYRELSAYPEVPEMLSTLKREGFATGILSNGSPDMLASAIKSSGISGCLDHVLSVESVGVFKPHASVYALVEKAFGAKPKDTLFVSSNGWDAAAAAGFGFEAAWVNRNRDPDDRLPWRPRHVLESLEGIPALAGSI